MSRSVNPDTTLVVGSGAMACLFGARLMGAGQPVMLLGEWPQGVDAIRRSGVRLVSADGSVQVQPVPIEVDPNQCRGVRQAIVVVKSWQTARAARRLAVCLAENGIALTLQNGLGNCEALAAELGEARVALGVTTQGATLLEPGLVRPVGESRITLGAHPGLDPLSERLRFAGFDIHSVPDVETLLWSKLVINAAINPLTALLRVSNGELLERPTARSLMHAVAMETAAVAAGQGIPLSFSDPPAAAEAVAQRTSGNRSSMLQDVQRGAQTEIDAICGAIVRAGETVGIPTPLNRTLLLLIQALLPEIPELQTAGSAHPITPQ